MLLLKIKISIFYWIFSANRGLFFFLPLKKSIAEEKAYSYSYSKFESSV